MAEADFRLTEDHIKLVRAMYIDWDSDAYAGAPAVGLKRPYGNSDVIGDVYEIVFGEAWDYEFGNISADLEKDLLKLHRDTDVALQIILVTGTFEPGTYYKTETYDRRSWAKREETK